MNERCSECRFWKEYPGMDNVGLCKRYAPRKICGVGTGYDEVRWPETGGEDWCGEWEIKPTNTPDCV